MNSIKMISIVGKTEMARAAADYINQLAGAQGRTAEDREWFEQQITECDEWIASNLEIEEYDCEIEE